MSRLTRYGVGVGILAAILSVGAVAGVRHRSAHEDPAFSRAPSSHDLGVGYSPGDRLQIGRLDFSKASHTLLIFLTTNCQYCIDSVPAYRGMIEEPSHRPGELQIVVVGLEPIEPLRHFLASYQLHPDDALTVSPEAVGIRTTPTLMLMDRNGVIQQVLVGQQAPARWQMLKAYLQDKPS